LVDEQAKRWSMRRRRGEERKERKEREKEDEDMYKRM
jgi:hypothetical protein